MDIQETKFNFKIILAALIAVVIGVLIAFYYSYTQSSNEISFLEQKKELPIGYHTIMKEEVDRLSAKNEVMDIDLQDYRFRVQRLLDSVGQLNFTIYKLKAYKKELQKLKSTYDSLKLKNNFFNNNYSKN